MRTIWFDMDGTIADLYGVADWLPKLRSEDTSPYTEAKPMLNFSLLARYLNKLQIIGYQIGIISWTAKDCSYEYHLEVGSAKVKWLKEHLPSVGWDYEYILFYGEPKELCMKATDDILFDDNEEIRNQWYGEAYEPSQILSVLKELAQAG